MTAIDTDQRRTRLARRHHLASPASSAEKVAEDLVGFHSSDPSAVFLSARARVAGLSVADLERALYEDRRLIRMHGMRRTMFVVPADLEPVVRASCTQGLIAKERKRFLTLVEQQGLAADPKRWLRDIEKKALAALEARGEATTAQLTKDVPGLARQRIQFGEGTKWAGTLGVGARVLFLLALEGRVSRGQPRGTWISSQYRWHLADPPHNMPSPKDAARRLVARWLSSYGPGTELDIKWWTGWTVGQVREVLTELEAVEVDLGKGIGWVLAEDVEMDEPPPSWVALLPGLDSSVMGWKERDWYLGDHQADLFDRNGNAGPTIWLDGRVVGGWAQPEDGRVIFRLLEPVGSEAEGLIENEAGRLTDWLAGVRVTPRFRTPLEKELAGR